MRFFIKPLSINNPNKIVPSEVFRYSIPDVFLFRKIIPVTVLQSFRIIKGPKKQNGIKKIKENCYLNRFNG